MTYQYDQRREVVGITNNGGVSVRRRVVGVCVVKLMVDWSTEHVIFKPRARHAASSLNE